MSRRKNYNKTESETESETVTEPETVPETVTEPDTVTEIIAETEVIEVQGDIQKAIREKIAELNIELENIEKRKPEIKAELKKMHKILKML